MIRRLAAISLRALGWAFLGCIATLAIAWWPNRSLHDRSVVWVDVVERGPYLYRVDSLRSARGCWVTWDVLWDVTSVRANSTALEQTRQASLQEARRRPTYIVDCGVGRTAPQRVRVGSPYWPIRFGRFARDPWASGEQPIGATFAGTDIGVGWPFVALWFNANESSPANGFSLSRDEYRVSRSVPFIGGWSLALAPAWPGFLLNTAIFGAAFFGVRQLVGFSVASIRARARSRSHLCPRCAYDLRGLNSPTCPECGTPRTPAPLAPASTS